jgi:hypothetical protein
MVSIVLTCLVIGLIIPLFVALVESRRKQLDLKDHGYWTLARALLGGTHLRLKDDPSLLVYFEHETRQCRMHVYQKAGETNWYLEGRVYQDRPFRFTARLCLPHQPALVPNLPELEVIKEFEKHEDYKVFSIESNDLKKLSFCLEQAEMKQALKDLNRALKSSKVEVLLLNTGISIRMKIDEAGLMAGDVMEKYGPNFSVKLKEISDILSDFSYRLKIFNRAEGECPVSAYPYQYETDVWACPSCGQKMMRSAMEISKGCFSPYCEESIDGVPQALIKENSVFVDEVNAHELSPFQFNT